MADVEVSENAALGYIGGAGPNLLRGELVCAHLVAKDYELVVCDRTLVLRAWLAERAKDTDLFKDLFVRVLRRPFASPFLLFVLDCFA